jgi:hypothetical protein
MSDVDRCVATELHTRKGEQLGRGEQGVTYTLTGDTVLKVSTLGNKAASAAWLSEARIGKALGELAIAPRIDNFFICKKSGFIQMERLTPIPSKTFATRAARKGYTGSEIRWKVKKPTYTDTVDHIANMPWPVQEEFVRVLTLMLEHGYIHMDNHVDNLGFIDGRPVVFDFGFTQQRDFRESAGGSKRGYTGSNQYTWLNIALAFSIFQMLEHCPTAEIQTSYLLHALCECLCTKRYTGCTLEELSRQLHRQSKGSLDAAAQWARDNLDPSVADLYVGCVAYATILLLPRVERYPTFEYDLIYKIRNPQAKYSKAVNAFAKKYAFYTSSTAA